jgi:hypothetical protein
LTQSIIYEIHDPASGSLVQVTEERAIAEKYFGKNYYVVENRTEVIQISAKIVITMLISIQW